LESIVDKQTKLIRQKKCKIYNQIEAIVDIQNSNSS